jgi:hypothetical protein
MVGIRFQDASTERKALGLLIGRFSFKSFDDGLTIVPPSALSVLAAEGLKFTVEGQASYERRIPSIRNPAAGAVQ